MPRVGESPSFAWGDIGNEAGGWGVKSGRRVLVTVIAKAVLLLLLLLSRLSHVWLCNPIDSSPSGSPVPGILQARILEWVAISNAWKWKVKVKSLSCVQLLVTPWTAVHQAPPSMGFSRQEYWSGVPLPSPSIIFTENTVRSAFKSNQMRETIQKTHLYDSLLLEQL